MLKLLAKKICDKHNYKKIDFARVTKCLGSGREGHAYMYKRNQVIKFFNKKNFTNFNNLLKLIKLSKKYKSLCTISQYDWVGDLFWIRMEYCPKKLSRQDIYYIEQAEDDLDDEEITMGFYNREWYDFIRSLLNFKLTNKIEFIDFHQDNILYDKNNNLKLIDYFSSDFWE